MKKAVHMFWNGLLLVCGGSMACIGMLIFVTMPHVTDQEILAEMIPVTGYAWLLAFALFSGLFWRMRSWKWATALLACAALLMCLIVLHPIPDVTIRVFDTALPGPAFIAGVLAAATVMPLVVATRFGMFYREAPSVQWVT